MTRIKSNDDPRFDRLVDGELSATERQQLLASLDDPLNRGSENGWRLCALAFLEAQAWGHQLKQMIAEPTEALPSIVPGRESLPTGTPLGRWLAVAASLLLAFAFGWLTNAPSTTNQQQPELAAHNQEIMKGHELVKRHELVEKPERPLRQELLPALSADAVTLLVRDTNGKHQRFQVPLMEVEQLDDQFSATLPAEVRAHFRDQGFDVQRRRRFAPMFFEQNQQLVPMVVPVDDTYVVPVNRPVF